LSFLATSWPRIYRQQLVRRLALNEDDATMPKEAVIVMGIIKDVSLRMDDKCGPDYLQVLDTWAA
jgi:hypothetical protein